MKGSKIKLGLIMGVLGILLAFAGQISAQTYKNERQAADNLRRLQDQMSTFRYDLQSTLSRVRMKPYSGEDINKSLEDLEGAIRAFNDDFRAKRENSDGVNNMLREARDIDVFLHAVDLGDPVAYDWSRVRSILDQLAANYQVSWDWNQDTYSDSQPVSQTTQTSGNFSYGLSGAYRLNAADSENAREVADRAVLIIAQRDRDRIKAELEDKLTPPENLTLDIRGQQVTLNSSRGGQINFTADGSDKYQTTTDGRNVRVRATLKNDRLTVTSVGERDNDYTVIFESIENGRRLRVTRRVTYESMSQTVMAESVYDKVSDVAQSGGNNDPGTYSDSNPGSNPGSNTGGNPGNNYPNQYPGTSTGRRGDFIVPNGTIISATLENDITTKVSQDNDRFRMTVQTPNEYRGAVIEGYVSGIRRSGKINGRAQITFNFERIRLKNGETYEFAGFLQSITNANGEIVKIDTEGVAKGDSQTKETAKRGGIGAGIGAIIGGVIGGVKGAVIGATIGASAGAGSVYVQGKDDLELKQGSTVGIQATAPNR
jgi:hypothetical protein